MSLEKAIANWYGKSAEYIGEIYKGYAHEENFDYALIAFCSDPALQVGATWLIKRHLENEGAFEPDAVAQLYESVATFKHWEAKLHVLQCLPNLPIPKDSKKTVEAFVRSCLTEKNKFVRAWAYNGFHELAAYFPEYSREVEQLLESALEEEAASVKARIRHIRKTK